PIANAQAPAETVEHFLQCLSGDPPPARSLSKSAADKWAFDYQTTRSSFVGITTTDWAEVEAGLVRYSRQGMRVEESSVRRLLQVAYRSKLHYTRARWVHRNDCQIEREHDSDITPERRRKLMCLEQTSEVERENGVPKWPSTMKKRDDEFRHYAFRVQAAISAGRSAS
ncbi:hypothetical protein GGI17_004988, partial [Coemansia sp. S146]